MRQIYILTLCTLAMLASIVACNKEESGSGDNEPVMVNASWTASTEAFESASKASLADNLSVRWEEGDVISVFSGRTNQQIPAVSAEGQTAVFAGEVEQSETYLAVYPYNADASSTGDHITTVFPASQTLVAGSADPAAMIAAARTTGTELNFRNIVALVGITFVAGEDEDVQTDLTDFYIVGGEEDRLSGKARYNTGSGAFTPITGSNRIDVTGDPQVEQTYYIAMMPGEYQRLTVSVTNADKMTTDFVIEENTVSFESNKVYDYEINLSEGDWILRPPTGQSYTFITKAEFEDFCDNPYSLREDVENLIITGDEITGDMLDKLQNRVNSVKGDFILDGINVTSTSGFGYFTCEGGITFKNCESLTDISWFNDYTEIGGDLVIENCPALGQGFNSLQTVEGTLRLQNTPVRIGIGASFSALTTVGGNLEVIDNDSEALTSFSGSALTSIGQSLVITGNTHLVSLAGLDRLTSIGGDITILDNGAIPELSENGNVGYCIIQDYKDFVISSMSVIRLGTTGSEIDIEELRYCDGTKPGEPRNYTVTDRAQLNEYISRAVASGEKETVNNLTISGSDITSTDLSKLDDWIYDVLGTLTIENLTFAGSDGNSMDTNDFLPAMTHDNVFSGSIVFRNITGGIFPNGFENIYTIKGDFIMEDCPRFWTEQGWNGLRNIQRVEGDLVLRRSAMSLSGAAFADLEYVGGDLVLEDLTLWYMDGADITYIGGDLVIKDNSQFWGLNGFENLTHVDNVIIENYGELQMTNGPVSNVPWAVGLCLLRDLYDAGVIEGTVAVSNGGVSTDFDDIYSCDGTAPDPGPDPAPEDTMDGSGEKFDDPDNIENWN